MRNMLMTINDLEKDSDTLYIKKVQRNYLKANPEKYHLLLIKITL